MKSKILKSIDPMSAAKIGAILTAVICFVYVILVMLIVVAAVALRGGHALSAVTLIALLIIASTCGAIAGFILCYVAAALYNLIAYRIGGAMLDISGKPYALSGIEPVSYAKINALIYGAFGLFAGIMLAIFIIAFASSIALLLSNFLTIAVGTLQAFGVLMILLLPIASVIGGFALGLIYAVLYNFLASRLGGVKFGLSKGVLNTIDPMSYAKIAAAINAIFGLVGALFNMPHFLLLGGIGMIMGIVDIVVSPILDAVIAFIFGYVLMLLYNWLASRIGGVRVVIS
jgi:hypothetical protein